MENIDIDILKEIFVRLSNKYSADINLSEQLWSEIEKNYSSKERYYHNLQHIQNMYSELESHKHLISDWDTMLFSLFYHDIIYISTAKDNEEKSAKKAIQSLTLIDYPQLKIDNCKNQILATKTHLMSTDNDINLFTDADLSILGSDWNNYHIYSKQVRKEYSVYPDSLYNPGRIKVLKHFLDMDFIFKTVFFRDKYEIKAKENLLKELNELIAK